MLKLLSFSFLIVAANALPRENQQVVQLKQRIVGGDIAPINSLPYQAQLLRDGQLICGGSIISERWILSAAHCLENIKQKLSVITGSDLVAKGGEQHEIERIVLHPAYDTDTDDNDIALIELKKKIKFKDTQWPIELASTVPQTGEIMTVSGFGQEAENGEFATSLEVTTIPVVDYETCKSKYVEDPLTENMFCAGEGPTDACQGDSGGPAVIDEKLVGVVSAGMNCGDTFYPGIYTRVANYRQWIDETMKSPSPKLEPKPEPKPEPKASVGGIFQPRIKPPTVLNTILNRVFDFIH